MALFNRVTERQPFPSEAWLVSCTWRAGHDKRVIRLENLFGSKADADAEVARLNNNANNYRDMTEPVVRRFTEQD